jgi:hypothetical protein
LLLYRILNRGQELDSVARTQLDSSFKVRDRLIHLKPGGHVAASELDSAFGGFWYADMLLGKAWVRARSNRRPRSVPVQTYLTMERLSDGEGKI